MTWVTMVLVGLGSYAFRVTPLLVLPRLTLSPRVERAVRHGGSSAITALVVASVAHRGSTGDLGPTLLAVGVGLVLAMRGASMLRIVIIGGSAYAVALWLWTAVA